MIGLLEAPSERAKWTAVDTSRDGLGPIGSNGNILGQGFEPLAVALSDRDGNCPGLAGINISNRTGFTFVCSTSNRAKIAIAKLINFRNCHIFLTLNHAGLWLFSDLIALWQSDVRSVDLLIDIRTV
jgi:hypothetical protein